MAGALADIIHVLKHGCDAIKPAMALTIEWFGATIGCFTIKMFLMKKSLLAVAVFCSVLFGAAEVVARYYLGLGTPPLSVAHPSIEYMFAPNQSVYRFGNEQTYNEFGMRSAPIEAWGKRDRVIVFGDSVLNGGNLTHQADLATELLSDERTVYGNVSAGSWGPANMRAWVEEFGILGAKKAIVVVSSHDLMDIPTFAPLNPQTHPVRAPLSAAQEGVSRYLPRYLPGKREVSNRDEGATVAPSPDMVAKGLAEIAALVNILREKGADVCFVKHLNRSELLDGVVENHNILIEALHEMDVPVVNVTDQEDWTERAIDLYRDDIHVTNEGQRALAFSIKSCANLI